MTRKTEATRITSVGESHSARVWTREKRYLLMMMIRTISFISAMVAYLIGAPMWVAWTFIAASLFLPYVAVVMANATGYVPPDGPSHFMVNDDRPQLPRGRD